MGSNSINRNDDSHVLDVLVTSERDQVQQRDGRAVQQVHAKLNDAHLK